MSSVIKKMLGRPRGTGLTENGCEPAFSSRKCGSDEELSGEVAVLLPRSTLWFAAMAAEVRPRNFRRSNGPPRGEASLRLSPSARIGSPQTAYSIRPRSEIPD